jgi:hypothetical protein
MPKTVLHLFHADPASSETVELEVYVFGPAERMVADVGQAELNPQIDALVKAGGRVMTCIGIAQQNGAEDAFRNRNFALKSAAIAFPKFASEQACVINF